MISGRKWTAVLNCNDHEAVFERLDNVSPQASRSSEKESMFLKFSF